MTANPCRRSVPSAIARLDRHARQDRDHRRVARHPRGHLERESRELEAVGEFEPGERFADLLELVEAAARLHHDRPEAVVLLAQLEVVAGLVARLVPVLPVAIGLERLLADAVGGVAAVAGEPELLVQHRHRVGDARGRRHGEIGAVRLAARRVAVRVEVDEDRRPGEGRRLVDAAVQLAGAGGHLPVNALERVADLVLAHAGGARRVFEQAVLKPDFADRPLRGEVVLRQAAGSSGRP